MSHTLHIVERPKRSLSLKNPLAQKLLDECGGHIDESNLPFLRGLAAGNLGKDDLKVIERLIERVEGGAFFDLHSQY